MALINNSNPEVSWLQSPLQLVRPDKLLSVYPFDSGRSPAERFNAFTRLVGYSSAIAWWMSGSASNLVAGAGLVAGYSYLSGIGERLETGATEASTAPVAPSPVVTAESATPSLFQTASQRVQDSIAVASYGDLVQPADPVQPDMPRPNYSAGRVATPQGVVQLTGSNTVSSGAGVASVPAQSSYLSMQRGEKFPGQKLAEARLTTGSKSVRGRSVIIPTPDDIKHAYRPVPPSFDTAGDNDYASGLVGRYKRMGRSA